MKIRNSITYWRLQIRITTNHYTFSEVIMLRILSDVQYVCPEMYITLLRYIIPIGVHELGLI